MKTLDSRECLVTLTGRIESDIRYLLLCDTTCCCCCATLERRVSHRRGVTAGRVGGADNGTCLSDGGADEGSG